MEGNGEDMEINQSMIVAIIQCRVYFSRYAIDFYTNLLFLFLTCKIFSWFFLWILHG